MSPREPEEPTSLFSITNNSGPYNFVPYTLERLQRYYEDELYLDYSSDYDFEFESEFETETGSELETSDATPIYFTGNGRQVIAQILTRWGEERNAVYGDPEGEEEDEYEESDEYEADEYEDDEYKDEEYEEDEYEEDEVYEDEYEEDDVHENEYEDREAESGGESSDLRKASEMWQMGQNEDLELIPMMDDNFNPEQEPARISSADDQTTQVLQPVFTSTNRVSNIQNISRENSSQRNFAAHVWNLFVHLEEIIRGGRS